MDRHRSGSILASRFAPWRFGESLLAGAVRHHPGAAKIAALAILAAACSGETGCVRRRLTVRTNPPGAQVFVDDQEIGTTPCSASFVYYGTRTVTVMKDGYRTEKIYQKLNPPWYEIPPLDFINENFNPFETRDERDIDVQLIPEQIVPQQKLLERAQMLRDGARTGTVTPLTSASLDAPRPPEPLGLPGQGLPGGMPLPYEPLPAPGAPSSPFRP
jgi:PEGA domain